MLSKACQLRICLLCAWVLTSANVVFAQSDAGQQQAALSEQLKLLIDAEGAVAAAAWFKDNWADSKDQYVVEPQAMLTLMSGYLNAGDTVAAQAVGKITASVLQDTMAESMQVNTPEMMEELNAQQQAEAKSRAALELRQQNKPANNTEQRW